MIDALLNAGDGQVNFPHRARAVGDSLGELTVVYPYIIRHEIVGNDVTILRAWHGMRRP